MKNLIVIALLFLAPVVFSQELDFNSGAVKERGYYEEIGFEYVKEKIIIPVQINNKTYRFLLDTGAPNIISTELFKEINPQLLAQIPVEDANQIIDTLKVVNLKALGLGETVFVNTTTLVHDLNSNPIMKCFNIDGFIGSNMLSNAILHIDLANKKIKLTDKKRHLNLKRKHSIKMELIGSQKSPFVWINLKKADKAAREQVLIDTGMEGFYDLSLKNYKKFESENILQLLETGKGSEAISLFENLEETKHLRILIPELELVDATFEHVISVTTNDNNSRLGSEILEHGQVTINFKNKRFYFKPFHEKINLQEKLAGFSPTIKNGKVIVGVVWDEALKGKLKHGDEVLTINGIPQTNICNLIKENSVFHKEDHLVIEFKDENEKVFKLEIEKEFPKFKS